MMTIKNKQQGFTLIELLIAISIFSTIAIASYSSLSNFNKSSAVIKKNIEKIEKLQTFVIFLNRDFSQVFDQQITMDKNTITIDSLQNDKITTIRYLIKENSIIRIEDNTSLVVMDNIEKIKVRLLDKKKKWNAKWKKVSGRYIIAIEFKFKSSLGEIIKLVMLDE